MTKKSLEPVSKSRDGTIRVFVQLKGGLVGPAPRRESAVYKVVTGSPRGRGSYLTGYSIETTEFRDRF